MKSLFALGRLLGKALRLDRSRTARLRTRAWRIGQRGENAAQLFLENAGYETLCRNWRAPRNLGELDIVCRNDEGTLCIVEVKTRRRHEETTRQPSPIEAVDADKRRNLRRAVMAYLTAIGKPDVRFRYDVIEVWSSKSGTPKELRHWIDLF